MTSLEYTEMHACCKHKYAESLLKLQSCVLSRYCNENKRIAIQKLRKMSEAIGYSKSAVEEVVAEMRKLEGACYHSIRCFHL